MKKFTKITLILAAVMAGIGVFCLLGSFALGMNIRTAGNMFDSGKFSFNIGDISFGFGNFGFGIAGAPETGSKWNVDEEIRNLDISLGSGELEVYYDDVEQIQVQQEGISGFETAVDDGTLEIEGVVRVRRNGSGKITLIIPKNMKFKEVQLEIGAGEANIEELKVGYLDIEVGAGEAAIWELDVEQLDGEVGVGQLTAELVGSEEDYNYRIESGIGEVQVGGNSYGGFGRTQNITNPGASRTIDMECGIGSVSIDFEE